MTTFKGRDKKRNKHKNILTLDARHKEKVKYFTNLEQSVNEKEQELIELKNKIEEMDVTMENYLELIEYKDQIHNLEKEIQQIKRNKEEKNYYLDVGELLYQYYGTKNTQQTNSYAYSEKNKNIKNDDISIMSFFSRNIDSKTKVNKNMNKEKNETKTRKERIRTMSVSGLFKEYMSCVDNSFLKKCETEEVNVCVHCDAKLTLYLSEGVMVCKNCGYEETVLIDSDKPSYKEPPKEVQFFSYQRINHLNEWLAQFQAKETTQIPNELYDKILLEIKKERITNMATLSITKVREILKKLKYNKYYEHIPHIINKLNGIPPPVISRENEEKIRRMFKEIQAPFHKHCPKGRKNFLSYSYVLHKFMELLSMDEFLICFPLLKSREKLHQQDQIWKKICRELRWEYVPSL